MATKITVTSGEDLRRIQARARDKRILGSIIGGILVSQSQLAFQEQKMGDYLWPERYPSQEDPFINIAGVVSWTGEGGQILPRFFDRRPALIGTGDLLHSINPEVSGDTVKVGSVLPYAGVHQWGGESVQPITSAAKSTIAAFLAEEPDPGRPGRYKPKKDRTQEQEENRRKYWGKLFPLLGMGELKTEINQRPFLGITEQNEKDIAEGIEYYIAGRGL